MSNSICWECAKSINSGCSWSDGFVPVEGWVAEAEDNKSTRSYCVKYCPEFVRDTVKEMDPNSISDEVMFDLITGIIDNALTDYEIALEYVERHRRRYYEARLQGDWMRARSELLAMRKPDKVKAIEEVPRWLRSEYAQLMGVGGKGEIHLKYAVQRMMMRRAFRDLKAIVKPWAKRTEFYQMIEAMDVVDPHRLERAYQQARDQVGGRRGLLFRWCYESLIALKPTYRLDSIRIMKKYIPRKRRGIDESNQSTL